MEFDMVVVMVGEGAGMKASELVAWMALNWAK